MAPFLDSAAEEKVRDWSRSKAFEPNLTFEGVRLEAIVLLKCLLAAMYCVSRLFMALGACSSVEPTMVT